LLYKHSLYQFFFIVEVSTLVTYLIISTYKRTFFSVWFSNKTDLTHTCLSAYGRCTYANLFIHTYTDKSIHTITHTYEHIYLKGYTQIKAHTHIHIDTHKQAWVKCWMHQSLFTYVLQSRARRHFPFPTRIRFFGANVRRQDQFVGENEVKRKEERN
jgi:hypothetical protein